MNKFLKKNALWVRIAEGVALVVGVLLIILSLSVKGKEFKGNTSVKLSELDSTAASAIEAGLMDEVTYDEEIIFAFDKENKVAITVNCEALLGYDGQMKVPATEWEEKDGFLLVGGQKMGKIVGPVVGTVDLVKFFATQDMDSQVILVNGGSIAELAIGAVLSIAALVFEGMLCGALYLKKKKD